MIVGNKYYKLTYKVMDKKYHKCNYKKCKENAIKCISPDIDIKGLCYCKKHEWQVKHKYFSIVYEHTKK